MLLERAALNFKDRNVLSSQFIKFILPSICDGHENNNFTSQTPEKWWGWGDFTSCPFGTLFKIQNTPFNLPKDFFSKSQGKKKKKNATTNFYGLWPEILVFMACTRFQFISIYFPFNSTFNKTTEASLYSSLYSLISCSAENNTQIIRSHFGGAWPSVIKADRDICCLFRGTF